MAVAFIGAFQTGTSTTAQTLQVQTYDADLNPFGLVSVDSVASAPPPTFLAITGVHVSANLDGSFDVFWSVNDQTVATFEETFSADGQPLSERRLGDVPLTDAASMASGGLIAAIVTGTLNTAQTLQVQIYDADLNPLPLITVDSVTSAPPQTFGSITGVHVSANFDGSFDVFWSKNVQTVTLVNGTPVSSSTQVSTFEQT